MGRKRTLAQVLNHSGGTAVLRRLFRGRALRSLVVFNYHRIWPDDGPHHTPLESDVFETDVVNFDRQMAWLARNTRVLSEDELLELLARPRKLDRPATMVTFDDAYRDVYDLAYPSLRRHNVPATLFVPTDMIDNRTVGWWDIIAYLTSKAGERTIEFFGTSFDLPRQAGEAAHFLQEAFKTLPADQTQDVLPMLAAACDVEPPDAGLMDRQLMTWDQIREVDRNGVTVGSHTHTHTVLATIGPDRQRHEMATSREVLQGQLGRRVRSIAYPVGERRHISSATRQVGLRCGYRLGYTYLTGYNRWGEIEPMAVSRTSAPSDLATFVGTAVFPRLFTFRPPPGFSG